MITAALSDLPLYKKLSPNLAIAIDYILSTDFLPLAPGRYEVAGEAVFAIVNEYNTKPPSACEPETHRQYIDIQVMISGSEKFGYAPLLDRTPSTGFLPGNDVAFYTPRRAGLYHAFSRAFYRVFSLRYSPAGALYRPAPAGKKAGHESKGIIDL